MMTSRHHIGQGEQRGHQRVVFAHRQGIECAIGLWDAHRLSLSAIQFRSAPKSAVQTGGVQSFLTEDAGSIGPRERRGNEIADLDFADIRSNGLDPADEFMSHAATYSRWLAFPCTARDRCRKWQRG